MSLLNTFFNAGQLTNQGAQAMNTGLNLSSSFLSTGARNDNVWRSGGNLGTTGFSSTANSLGHIAGNFGPLGAGIQGGLQSVGAMADLYSYNPKVDALENSYSADNLPTFDLSDEASATDSFMDDFKSSANKKIGQSTLGGAAVGTAIAPGIGTAIGAGVGFIGSLFGKGKAKNEAEEAADKMQQEYSSAIGRFNTGTQQYYNKQNAMDFYRAQQKNQANMFNIPSASPYFYI
jgi:hypothetical protein